MNASNPTLLSFHTTTIDDKKGQQALDAIDSKEFNILTRSLDLGASPDTVDREGNSLLHRATRSNSPEIIEYLIKIGGSKDLKNKELQLTPLHMAVYHNTEENVNVLIKNNVNLNAEDKDKNTPFHWACCFEHLNLIDILLAAGADCLAENKNGETALDVVDRLGKDLVFEHLAKKAGDAYMRQALAKEDPIRIGALLHAGAENKIEYLKLAKSERVLEKLKTNLHQKQSKYESE